MSAGVYPAGRHRHICRISVHIKLASAVASRTALPALPRLFVRAQVLSQSNIETNCCGSGKTIRSIYRGTVTQSDLLNNSQTDLILGVTQVRHCPYQLLTGHLKTKASEQKSNCRDNLVFNSPVRSLICQLRNILPRHPKPAAAVRRDPEQRTVRLSLFQ